MHKRCTNASDLYIKLMTIIDENFGPECQSFVSSSKYTKLFFSPSKNVMPLKKVSGGKEIPHDILCIFIFDAQEIV